MAQDKYYYQQLPLTKNMQTIHSQGRESISIPNHKRKIKISGN